VVNASLLPASVQEVSARSRSDLTYRSRPLGASSKLSFGWEVPIYDLIVEALGTRASMAMDGYSDRITIGGAGARFERS
jgi:hypothetical protein